MFQLYGSRGAYKVDDRPFATGRTSMFHRAMDGEDNEVCIKLFRELEQMPQNVQRLDEFLREIRVRQQLKHANVLPILDHGVEEGASEAPKSGNISLAPRPRPFLVLPLCKGGDLRRVISQRDYTPLGRALEILRPVGAAIDFAHLNGIIHGDVKPENILFSGDLADVFLTDFGMSKYFVHRARISLETAFAVPGGGTPDYLSPEELDRSEQTPRSDIYALAVIAYELLTGRLPINPDAPPFRQMRDKVDGNLIRPRQANHRVAKAANDALLCGLSPEPDKRPASASEFCDMLTGAIAVPTGAVPVRGRTSKTRSRVSGFWTSLEPTGKVAVITGLIAAIAGVITALIAIVPDLVKR